MDAIWRFAMQSKEWRDSTSATPMPSLALATSNPNTPDGTKPSRPCRRRRDQRGPRRRRLQLPQIAGLASGLFAPMVRSDHPLATTAKSARGRLKRVLHGRLGRLLLQHLIALAGNCLQRVEVKNFNGTSRITDSAAGLDTTSHFCHRRATNAEHLRQEFLREHDRIALGSVTTLQ